MTHAFACEGAGYAFVPVLKVASSSIVQTLVKAQPAAERRDLEDCDGLSLFAFVRDPRDRLVSVWRNLVFQPPDGEVLLKGEGLQPAMPFLDFLNRVPDLMDDPHLTPQAELLADVRLDVIGKFETLETDWSLLQDYFPSLPPLKHVNRSCSPLADVELHGTVWQRVEELYRSDLDAFDY